VFGLVGTTIGFITLFMKIYRRRVAATKNSIHCSSCNVGKLTSLVVEADPELALLTTSVSEHETRQTLTPDQDTAQLHHAIGDALDAFARLVRVHS